MGGRTKSSLSYILAKITVTSPMRNLSPHKEKKQSSVQLWSPKSSATNDQPDKPFCFQISHFRGGSYSWVYKILNSWLWDARNWVTICYLQSLTMGTRIAMAIRHFFFQRLCRTGSWDNQTVLLICHVTLSKSFHFSLALFLLLQFALSI